MSNNRKFFTGMMALAVFVGVFSVLNFNFWNTGTAVYPAASSQTEGFMVPQASAAEKPVVIDDPVHLTIPNARVDASVIKVGVTKTNNLDVPPNFVQVGWYEYGTRPGQIGNAVLDGHVDNGGSIDGVFKHLRDLKTGDDIYIQGADGSQLHFKVQNSDVYLTTQFPSDVVFNQNSGQPILKIITCHGTYVPSTGTYDHRLVVTAVLASK